MALRKLRREEPIAQVAKDTQLPCAFCCRSVEDELNYGKMYAIGDIQCHYFCALLSCCLVQKGKDSIGLFGFLYQDILAEVARAKKHKCSYCLKSGANMGCCFTQCRKQFHLPCGRERNAVSLFYGSYKSYCQLHAPRQKIPDNIMAKARLRKKYAKDPKVEVNPDLEAVCVICYEEVQGFPTTETFWPPCCAKDAWFHRSCLQRMSLSAGMHYLKCPLCNDKNIFYEAVTSQGYYVPDRDAAWELEQNAFAEIYERTVTCSAVDCECPMGRSHDADNGSWDIKLCILCGSTGIHSQCQGNTNNAGRYVCATCQPAAPADLDSLAESIEAVILSEQRQNTPVRRHGPIMPCRMSLRRTKAQAMPNASSLSSAHSNNIGQHQETSSTSNQCRLELNLKSPKRASHDEITSPFKLIEQSLNGSDLLDIKKVLDLNGVEKLKRKLQRPRPMSAKRRIVNELLKEILNTSDIKQKEPIKEWSSPKKLKHEEVEELVKTEVTENEHDRCENKENITNKVLEFVEMSVDDEITVDVLKEKSLNNIDTNLNVDNNINVDNNEAIVNNNDNPNASKVDLQFEENTTKPGKSLNLKIKLTKNKKSNMPSNVNEIFKLSQNQSNLNRENENLQIDKDNLNYANISTIIENTSEDLNNSKDLNNLNTDSVAISNQIKLTENEEVYLEPEEVNASEDIQENEQVTRTDDVKKETSDTQIFSPKNLKTLTIDNDSSVEISKDNQFINIDVVKIESNTDVFKMPDLKSPEKNNKCFLKFSSTNKEVLRNNNINLDLESFKNHYLSEVDGERCKINNVNDNNNRKRKLEETDTKNLRETKINNEDINISEIDIQNKISKQYIENCPNIIQSNEDNNTSIKNNANITSTKNKKNKKRLVKNTNKKLKEETSLKLSLKNKNDVQLDIDTKKSDKKKKTKLSVKIKWREERLKLKITQRKRKIEKKKCLKQYILKCDVGEEKIIAKPDTEITPPKRKHVKLEKVHDKLFQTSIDNFFKKMS